ncbi:MAG TPA: hypothetical protein VHC18_26155 [Amycolatopsis sp.]|nr:hypothetical protein [Amycolatopsis sp.]
MSAPAQHQRYASERASHSPALGDPVPHHIDAALVGDPAADPSTVDAVQRASGSSLCSR